MAESCPCAAGKARPIVSALGWSALLVSLYLPALATRFDFIDDGSLVYPHGDGSVSRLVRRIWDTTLADYQQRGPFRPVLWAHLVAEAEWLRADAFAWRAVHLVWALLSAATFLWMLRELGIHPAAAVLTAAVAMWNPYRGETWINLTVTEAIAMPYALGALACAVRALRSPHPTRWDIAGALCVLAALGCKNTFAAVVPAQLLLRLAPDGISLRDGWRRHGGRAGLLALTLLFPAAHYLAFKLSWHEGRYQTAGASWAQLWRMIRTVRGALSFEFLAPGLMLACWTLWRSQRARGAEHDIDSSRLSRFFAHPWQRYRGACLAAVLLLLCGVGVYLPIDGVAGRYAIPAVWGADLLVAILLSELVQSPPSRWRTGAFAAVGVALFAVAIANLGKQDKFNARASLLWQALEAVERQAPPNACLAWRDSGELTVSEAIHFQHHIHARGRGDLSLLVLDEPRTPSNGPRSLTPAFALSERAEPPAAGQWQLLREFRIPYWRHLREYRCYLFHRDPAPNSHHRAMADGGQ